MSYSIEQAKIKFNNKYYHKFYKGIDKIDQDVYEDIVKFIYSELTRCISETRKETIEEVEKKIGKKKYVSHISSKTDIEKAFVSGVNSEKENVSKKLKEMKGV